MRRALDSFRISSLLFFLALYLAHPPRTVSEELFQNNALRATNRPSLQLSALSDGGKRGVWGATATGIGYAGGWKWRAGAELSQYPWNEQESLLMGEVVGAVTKKREHPLSWGGGVIFRKLQYERSLSGGIIFPVLLLSFDQPDRKREFLLLIPIRRWGESPLEFSFALAQDRWESHAGFSWSSKENLFFRLGERMHLNETIDLSLAVSGPPATLQLSLGIRWGCSSLSVGAIKHAHWNSLGLVNLSRNLSLPHELTSQPRFRSPRSTLAF